MHLTAIRQKKEVEAENTKTNKTNIGEMMAQYEATIHTTDDRQLFEAFKENWASYLRAQQGFLNSITPLSDDAQIEAGHERLHPSFTASLAAIDAVLEENNNAAIAAALKVSSHVDTLRIGMLAGFVAAVVLRSVQRLLLIAAVTRRLDRLGAAMNLMTRGILRNASLSSERMSSAIWRTGSTGWPTSCAAWSARCRDPASRSARR